jgi:hypothetical protein
MHYCGVCFTSRNALLPQPENMLHQGRPPALLAMSTVLFLHQASSFDLIFAVNSLLDQAVAMAEQRGLLIAYPTTPPSVQFTPPSVQFTPPPVQFTPPPWQQEAIPSIDQLIPRRKRDTNLMLADNPFASKAAISDKHARRLHLAIDGHTAIAALSVSTGMTMNEIYEALRILLKQNRIELYEPDGQPARHPLFPDNL